MKISFLDVSIFILVSSMFRDESKESESSKKYEEILLLLFKLENKNVKNLFLI